MTPSEHKLMVSMFTRMNESIGILANTLTSRGLWTGDDAQAFAHAIHADQKKLQSFALQALTDYQTYAEDLGVETGL